MQTNITPRLPRGMRLNNPGNLRRSMGVNKVEVLEDGFAKFDNLLSGTFALVKLTAIYWEHHGYRTLADFVGHYAPAKENDVIVYQNAVAVRCRLNPLKASTQSLDLDRAWRALDFMRAIVSVEQGNCDPSQRSYPEWVPLHHWLSSMEEIPMWKGQL